MTVVRIHQYGVTRSITDIDLVDHLLRRAGISLYRRLQVRQSGSVREWLTAGHTAAEMVTLAQAGEGTCATQKAS